MSRNSYSPAYFSLVPDRLNEKTHNTNSACTSKGRGIPASQKRHTQQHTLCEQIHAPKKYAKKAFSFIFICSLKKILYLDTNQVGLPLDLHES